MKHAHRAGVDSWVEGHLLRNARLLAARQGPGETPALAPTFLVDLETVGPFPDRAGEETGVGRLVVELGVSLVLPDAVIRVFESTVHTGAADLEGRDTWILDNGHISREELEQAPPAWEVRLQCADKMREAWGRPGPLPVTSYNWTFDVPLFGRFLQAEPEALESRPCVMKYVGAVVLARHPDLVPPRKRAMARKTGEAPWLKAEEAVRVFQALGYDQPDWSRGAR